MIRFGRPITIARRLPRLLPAVVALLALVPIVAHAQEFQNEALRHNGFMEVIVVNKPWGLLLISLSFAILAMIFFCMRSAGNAFRSGSREAFSELPKRLDPDGLQEFKEQTGDGEAPREAGPLRRALQVGLVSGRGGLLISKSAVLTAWASERQRYRLWPSLMLAAGVISLALALLSGAHLLNTTINYWQESVIKNVLPDEAMFTAVRHAYILLLLGLTNFFIGLLLYFLFDRMTQWFLNRTTTALIRYLGSAIEAPHTDFTPAASSRKTAVSE